MIEKLRLGIILAALITTTSTLHAIESAVICPFITASMFQKVPPGNKEKSWYSVGKGDLHGHIQGISGWAPPPNIWDTGPSYTPETVLTSVKLRGVGVIVDSPESVRVSCRYELTFSTVAHPYSESLYSSESFKSCTINNEKTGAFECIPK